MQGITWRACAGRHCHIGKELKLEDSDFLIKEADGKLRLMNAERFNKLFKQVPGCSDLDDVYKK